VVPAADVIPLDQRGWADKNLESYAGMVEPFAASVGGGGATGALFAQMAPAIIGLQAGSLVGSLSTWVMAGFDAGLPPDRPGPMTLIVPNIEALDVPGVDQREIRMWVVANEAAFRAVAAIPWIHDHIAGLLGTYAEATQIDPSKLSGLMMGGSDPAEIEKVIEDAGGIEALLGGEGAEEPRAELEAFLGAVTGCARLLARRAVAEIVPAFEVITAARDAIREEEGTLTPPIGVGAVPVEATRLGEVFVREVENRYGADALGTLWADPSRMPSAAELRDPTAWAARVLLDGWD
jgi:putative hydrolase